MTREVQPALVTKSFMVKQPLPASFFGDWLFSRMENLFFFFFEKKSYPISSVIRRCFFLSKQSQKSRSILSDGSRSLGLFRKGKTRITAKLHRTDLIICTHSGVGKPRLIAE